MSEKEAPEYAGHEMHCDIQVLGGRVFEGMSVYCSCGYDADPAAPLRPWARANKACRHCKQETEHQFIPLRGVVCLTCGTTYREEEKPVKVSADDIWGG